MLQKVFPKDGFQPSIRKKSYITDNKINSQRDLLAFEESISSLSNNWKIVSASLTSEEFLNGFEEVERG